MPRIRTIKPEFFHNEVMAELPALAQLLFIGLWTLADRRGRLEDRPKRIKGQLFPYTDADLEPLLQGLHDAGFILRYTVIDDATGQPTDVIQIINFEKHQRISGSESDSESPYPPPQNAPPRRHNGNTSQHEGSTKEAPRKHQGSSEEATRKHDGSTLDDRKGKERKGREYIPPTPLGVPQGPQAHEPTIPDRLATITGFDQAWAEWGSYRRQIRKPLRQTTITKQLETLSIWASMGYDPVEIINTSIRNGWQGLFQPKGKPHGSAHTSSTAQPHRHVAATDIVERDRRFRERHGLPTQGPQS